MDRLDRAVEAGIISNAQLREIRALEDDKGGLQLTLVHLLWLAGSGLILFALWLLAIRISDGEISRLVWVCLTYAAGFFALDRIVAPRTEMRVLSSLLMTGLGITLSAAIAAWLSAHFGHLDVGARWNQAENPLGPLLHGPWLPAVPVIATSGLLILRRGFLPAWSLLVAAVTACLMDAWFGLALDEVWATRWFILMLASAAFGVAWWCDLACRANHGFWFHKAGLIGFLVFTFDASFMRNTQMDSLLTSGVVLLVWSVYVRRPAGVAFGALAVSIWLADWFQAWDELYVAAALLAVCGVATVFAGIKAHLIEERLDSLLPQTLRRLRPARRDDPVTFGF